MVGFDRRVLDGSAHALGSAVGPRVIWLDQLVLDAVLRAEAIEPMRAHWRDRPLLFLGRSLNAMPLLVSTVAGKERRHDFLPEGGGVGHLALA